MLKGRISPKLLIGFYPHFLILDPRSPRAYSGIHGKNSLAGSSKTDKPKLWESYQRSKELKGNRGALSSF